MAEQGERVCIGCGDNEDMARLERCAICLKTFCPDCAYRATGRRFCSAECAREFFYGDQDDDEDADYDDE